MSFRKLQGVRLPEEKQGLVYFICQSEKSQPKKIREKIQRLCDEVGGSYSAALWDVMCTGKSMTRIAMEHYVSDRTLYRLRKKFYEEWYRKR